jgi:hypothetical protein
MRRDDAAAFGGRNLRCFALVTCLCCFLSWVLELIFVGILHKLAEYCGEALLCFVILVTLFAISMIFVIIRQVQLTAAPLNTFLQEQVLHGLLLLPTAAANGTPP